MLIREIMQTELITIDPEMSILAVEELLTERRIGGAPVVSSSGELLGVVSKTDLLQGTLDVMARLPQRDFPGGTLLRWPGLVAGMLYYSLRDKL